jgi:hypothetical protein
MAPLIHLVRTQRIEGNDTLPKASVDRDLRAAMPDVPSSRIDQRTPKAARSVGARSSREVLIRR